MITVTVRTHKLENADLKWYFHISDEKSGENFAMSLNPICDKIDAQDDKLHECLDEFNSRISEDCTVNMMNVQKALSWHFGARLRRLI
jgi:hypothetical protein